MNWDLLISFIGATALLAISPGPDNIYVLVQSIVNGKNAGMATVSGLISGCIVHTSLLAFGISTVIKSNATVFFIIKIFGALYLLFLAYKVFMSKAEINLNSNVVQQKNMLDLFGKGFLMNVLNPKVTMFFLAFFPAFLFHTTMSTEIQFFVLGGIFMLTSFVIFSLIALFAGSIKTYTLSHPSSARFFKWLQIITFVGIATFILF
jgi:threonine/homoserine/homoserine lactone efflux protein